MNADDARKRKEELNREREDRHLRCKESVREFIVQQLHAFLRETVEGTANYMIHIKRSAIRTPFRKGFFGRLSLEELRGHRQEAVLDIIAEEMVRLGYEAIGLGSIWRIPKNFSPPPEIGKPLRRWNDGKTTRQ